MSHQAETRIASLLVVGMAAVGVASASEVPRTGSGKPDLSGNYDIGTLTPLQRSPEFGNRLFLTPAEAEEIRRSAAERTAQRSSPSDPNRQPPPVTGRLGGYNEFFHDRGTEAVAVDGKYRTSLLTDPPDGRFPPLTERDASVAKASTYVGNWRTRMRAPPGGAIAKPAPTMGPNRCRSPIAASLRSRPRSRCCRRTTTTSRPSCRPRVTW